MEALPGPELVFAIGGLAKANQPLWTAEVYESAHGAWRALPEMSTARGYLAVARGGPGTSSRGAREAASDREPTTVLALGGSDGARTLRSAEAFDFARGEWRSLAPMSAPRIWLGAATVGLFQWASNGRPPVGDAQDGDDAQANGGKCWGSAIADADGRGSQRTEEC